MVERNDGRELRLEGAGLFLIVAFLGAGLIGAFFLGRWYERSSAPPAGFEQFASDPLEHVVPPADVEDLDTGANHFDTVDSGETEAEPARQAIAPAVRDEPAVKPQAAAVEEKPAQEAAVSAGSFYVQIAAFRDRSSADKVVGELTQAGFAVKVFTENGASGRLFKVRVGGYPTRDEAVVAVASLQGAGYPGAFPTKVD